MKYTRREFLKTTSNTLIVTLLPNPAGAFRKGDAAAEFGKTGEKALLGLVVIISGKSGMTGIHRSDP